MLAQILASMKNKEKEKNTMTKAAFIMSKLAVNYKEAYEGANEVISNYINHKINLTPAQLERKERQQQLFGRAYASSLKPVSKPSLKVNAHNK